MSLRTASGELDRERCQERLNKIFGDQLPASYLTAIGSTSVDTVDFSLRAYERRRRYFSHDDVEERSTPDRAAASKRPATTMSAAPAPASALFATALNAEQAVPPIPTTATSSFGTGAASARGPATKPMHAVPRQPHTARVFTASPRTASEVSAPSSHAPAATADVVKSTAWMLAPAPAPSATVSEATSSGNTRSLVANGLARRTSGGGQVADAINTSSSSEGGHRSGASPASGSLLSALSHTGATPRDPPGGTPPAPALLFKRTNPSGEPDHDQATKAPTLARGWGASGKLQKSLRAAQRVVTVTSVITHWRQAHARRRGELTLQAALASGSAVGGGGALGKAFAAGSTRGAAASGSRATFGTIGEGGLRAAMGAATLPSAPRMPHSLRSQLGASSKAPWPAAPAPASTIPPTSGSLVSTTRPETTPPGATRAKASKTALPAHLQAQYDATVATAENDFEERQKQRTIEAMQRIRERPNSPRAQRAFAQMAYAVTSNRALPPVRPVVPEEHGPRKRYPKERPKTPPKPVVQAVKAVKDIWRPRAKWCDARDVYDNDLVEAKRFEVDWERAVDLGLAKLIMKRDDDAGKDEDGDGISDEVEEVKDVLWDCHDLIVQVFDYYASASGDMGSIGLNQWSEMVEDFELDEASSKYCRKADMDTLFIAINAASKTRDAKNGTKPGERDDSKSLNRVEFIACLVNVAIMKYVMPGKASDVSEALHVLLAEHLDARLDKQVFSDYNAFRARCYAPEVVEVLSRHEASLRNVFSVAAGGDPSLSPAAGKLLSLGEWRTLLKALGFIGKDVTERDARLCFACSRMAVIDARTAKGSSKENNLPFEGFLEALCRLSMLKALPTSAELQETGCSDAGIFLQRLRAGTLPEEFMDALEASSGSTFSDALGSFQCARGAAWGETSPVQPMEMCVQHIVACIVRTIEEDSRGDDNMVLTPNEIKDWARSRGVLAG